MGRSNRTNLAVENHYLAESRDIRQQMRRCWFLRLRLLRENALSVERQKHTSDSPFGRDIKMPVKQIVNYTFS